MIQNKQSAPSKNIEISWNIFEVNSYTDNLRSMLPPVTKNKLL